MQPRQQKKKKDKRPDAVYSRQRNTQDPGPRRMRGAGGGGGTVMGRVRGREFVKEMQSSASSNPSEIRSCERETRLPEQQPRPMWPSVLLPSGFLLGKLGAAVHLWQVGQGVGAPSLAHSSLT
jgi:hypothetical protein